MARVSIAETTGKRRIMARVGVAGKRTDAGSGDEEKWCVVETSGKQRIVMIKQNANVRLTDKNGYLYHVATFSSTLSCLKAHHFLGMIVRCLQFI